MGHHLGSRPQTGYPYAVDEQVFFKASGPGGDYGCSVIPKNSPRMELILVIFGEKNQRQRSQGSDREFPGHPSAWLLALWRRVRSVPKCHRKPGNGESA